MLEGISSLVAVVPVIAKADTHTAPELEAYRREVLQVSQPGPRPCLQHSWYQSLHTQRLRHQLSVSLCTGLAPNVWEFGVSASPGCAT